MSVRVCVRLRWNRAFVRRQTRHHTTLGAGGPSPRSTAAGALPCHREGEGEGGGRATLDHILCTCIAAQKMRGTL